MSDYTNFEEEKEDATVLDKLASLFQCCLGGEKVDFATRSVYLRRLIANGATSSVFEGKDRRSNERVAVKRILISDGRRLRLARWEIDVHSAVCPHRHLLPLLDFHFERNHCFLAFPLLQNGTVEDELNAMRDGRVRFMTEQKALRVLGGILSGLRQFHRQNLAHRDICPRNVLYSDDNVPILMDFGSTSTARVKVESRTDALRLKERAAVESSMPYRAPELFEPDVRSVISEKTDCWSLGCTLFAMLYGYSPFEVEWRESTSICVTCSFLKVLAPLRFPAEPGISSATMDLVRGLLCHDPIKRLGLEEAAKMLGEQLHGTEDGAVGK